MKDRSIVGEVFFIKIVFLEKRNVRIRFELIRDVVKSHGGKCKCKSESSFPKSESKSSDSEIVKSKSIGCKSKSSSSPSPQVLLS